MTAPGTALAVIHNPLVRPRPNGRMAIECTCHPGDAIAVQKAGGWTAGMVLDVEAQHVAAVEQHIATLADEVSLARFRSWVDGLMAKLAVAA